MIILPLMHPARMATRLLSRGMLLGINTLAPVREIGPQPAGVVGTTGIIGGVILMVLFNMAHALSVGLFIVVPLVVSTMIAVGWCLKGANRHRVSAKALEVIDEPPTRAERVNDMRSYAAELKLRRIAADLAVSCPLCESPPGISCRVTEGVMHYMMDQERELYAHKIRLQKAAEMRGEEVRV